MIAFPAMLKPLSVSPLFRRGAGFGSSSWRVSALTASLNNDLMAPDIVRVVLVGPAKSLFAGLVSLSLALSFPVAGAFAIPRFALHFLLLLLAVLLEYEPVLC